MQEGDETSEEKGVKNTDGGSGPDLRMSDDERICGGGMGAFQ